MEAGQSWEVCGFSQAGNVHNFASGFPNQEALDFGRYIVLCLVRPLEVETIDFHLLTRCHFPDLESKFPYLGAQILCFNSQIPELSFGGRICKLFGALRALCNLL